MGQWTRKKPITNTGEDNEDYPPGFTPLHVQTQPEVYPRRPSITIRPQQGQADTGMPINFQVGSRSNPRDNPANPVIPDLDIAEREETRIESSRQLEDCCRWLEEKSKALENADNHHGIDAKDLSLVLDLVLPHKFKMSEFKKYNGTSCTKAHITIFYRQMTWYVNNDQLLIHCFQDSLVGAASRWYNQLSRHSIENYTAFKKVVERLIKMGIVKFDDTPSAENPLPNHGDKEVNVIGESIVRRVKEDIAKVKTPLRRVWREMVGRGLIISDSVEGFEGIRDYYEFHKAEGHEIQECVEFRVLVQSLMDNKELEFYGKGSGGGNICATEGESTNQKVNYPRIIISRPRNSEGGTQMAPKVVIQKHVSFPYKDNKMRGRATAQTTGSHINASIAFKLRSALRGIDESVE
ncbi:hypothetical protein J1N35_029122 [Gossypium stocksii]|uniref:Retrotransposon gag domain-containing protein n=1 Tax=Gossypium stocksii TaxID=47602 RepID=A0A9D3ZT87_9ROSI|nr:hypothetical protein J1N35_029122 [Gossypium stocksii]